MHTEYQTLAPIRLAKPFLTNEIVTECNKQVIKFNKFNKVYSASTNV